MSYIDDFIAEAEKDNREGDHTATFQGSETKTWDNGDTTYRCKFTLDDAYNAKVDCDIPARFITEQEAASIKASGDRRKIRGVAGGQRLLNMLTEHYGHKSPAELKPGAQYAVKCVKTRVDPITNKGGFIRVIAFLPKGAGATKAGDPNPADIPF